MGREQVCTGLKGAVSALYHLGPFLPLPIPSNFLPSMSQLHPVQYNPFPDVRLGRLATAGRRQWRKLRAHNYCTYPNFLTCPKLVSVSTSAPDRRMQVEKQAMAASVSPNAVRASPSRFQKRVSPGRKVVARCRWGVVVVRARDRRME